MLLLNLHTNKPPTMKRLFYIIPFCTILFACSNDEKFKSVCAEEFASVISDTTVQILDVRTPDEFAEGHITGSRNIDVLDKDFELDALEVLDKDRAVALYCRSGRRSKKAAEILTTNGYQVVELSTRYNGWVEAGREVTDK
jgi:rhodanese-related sulfurtransferase